MLKIINSKIKEDVEDLYCKYPGCVFLLKIDNNDYNHGYVLAVSDSPDSGIELYNYAESLDNSINVIYRGSYRRITYVYN